MSSTEIRVPRETVNDDIVTVVRWLAADGDVVRTGMTVVELETSKSVIDVESPAAGRLTIRRAAGDQVPIGELLGVVGEPAAASSPAVSSPPAAAPSTPSCSTTAAAPAGGPTISAKARELMALHGIDEAALAHLALVREADVRAIIAAAVPAEQPPDRAPQPAARPAPAAPRGQSEQWVPRGLLGDAARASADRGTSVVWLAFNYLWRNWLLGNLVRVAPRGVINVLHRWRGVKMGRDCFIDPAAILETAYPENITLGDDVRVTAGAIVMTHIKAPHYLRDRGFVPAVLEPVVLEDHSFVGVNAVILPGVTVGRAAVVASGAVVTADVPPATMVAGNPAKVVKRFEERSTDT